MENSELWRIFAARSCKIHKIMAKKEINKENIFVKMLEIKRAIRKCIQNGGNLKQVEEEYGIKFAKPL